MQTWVEYLSGVHEHIRALESSGCDVPFYRGHGDETWKLIPSLGRIPRYVQESKNIESILYYDYLSHAGPLLAPRETSWDIVFSMQHHGLPTRLLDWTQVFGVALYFAIKDYLSLKDLPGVAQTLHDPAVWILDPFQLNEYTTGEPTVLNPVTDMTSDYQAFFIEESDNLDGDVIAISPTKQTPRLIAQKGVFRLHKEIEKPLEEVCPNVLQKFVLPPVAIPEAIRFLELAGINEYTLFPDLDGLARHLRRIHVHWS